MRLALCALSAARCLLAAELAVVFCRLLAAHCLLISDSTDSRDSTDSMDSIGPIDWSRIRLFAEQASKDACRRPAQEPGQPRRPDELPETDSLREQSIK